jgi:hypothetical protein
MRLARKSLLGRRLGIGQCYFTGLDEAALRVLSESLNRSPIPFVSHKVFNYERPHEGSVALHRLRSQFAGVQLGQCSRR